MASPYTEVEGTHLWVAVETAINNLVLNKDLLESTARSHIVGYICKSILQEREGILSQLLGSSSF